MYYFNITAICTGIAAVALFLFNENTKQKKEHTLLDLLDELYLALEPDTQDHIEEMVNVFWNCPYDRIIMVAGTVEGEKKIINTIQVDSGCSGKTADNKYLCIRYLILRAMTIQADIFVITRYDKVITAPHSMCGFRYDSQRYVPMEKQQLKLSPFSELKNQFGETPILREYKNGWY